MDLIYPQGEFGIFIPVELSGKKGRVIFEAVHRNQEATIYWHLDGKFIACTIISIRWKCYPRRENIHWFWLMKTERN